MNPKRKTRVLIVDDEAEIRSSLRRILEYESISAVEAGSGAEALKLVALELFDAVLLDVKMPQMDGIEVLGELRRRMPDLPVIVVSGHGTVATAVEATKLGAFDFMEKPLERDRVLLVLRNATEQGRLRDENRELRLAFEERYRIVGASPTLRKVEESIVRAAPTRASVLILGESGTGKELVARAIHGNSPRSGAAFVKVNCAAIPEELIESELFGHAKGSFTGASQDQVGKFVRADGGTLFLDEIGDMSLKTQAKALRVLQDGEVEPVGAAKTLTVDVRVIAATNKNLEEEIAAGRFREDLYFRLAVIPIRMPALRERREDIPALVDHFVAAICRENNWRMKRFSSQALAALQELPWRGNVRELRNVIERLLIMAAGDEVDLRDFPPGLGLPTEGTPAPVAGEVLQLPHGGQTLQAFKDVAEREFLVAKLREYDWNVTATSKAIDTPRSNLYKKLDAYGISREKDGL